MRDSFSVAGLAPIFSTMTTYTTMTPPLFTSTNQNFAPSPRIFYEPTSNNHASMLNPQPSIQINDVKTIYAILQQQQAMIASISALLNTHYQPASMQTSTSNPESMDLRTSEGVRPEVICSYCRKPNHSDINCYRKNKQCFGCLMQGHKIKDCRNRRTVGQNNNMIEMNDQRNRMGCGYCGRDGHVEERCYVRQNDQYYSGGRQKYSDRNYTNVVKCRYCHKLGHIEKNCCWKNRWCFYCGMSNHKIKDCQELKHQEEASSNVLKTKELENKKRQEKKAEAKRPTRENRVDDNERKHTDVKKPIKVQTAQPALQVTENRKNSEFEDVSCSLKTLPPSEKAKGTGNIIESSTAIQKVSLCMWCGEEHLIENCSKYQATLKIKDSENDFQVEKRISEPEAKRNCPITEKNSKQENDEAEVTLVIKPLPSGEAVKELNKVDESNKVFQQLSICMYCGGHHLMENCKLFVERNTVAAVKEVNKVKESDNVCQQPSICMWCGGLHLIENCKMYLERNTKEKSEIKITTARAVKPVPSGEEVEISKGIKPNNTAQKAPLCMWCGGHHLIEHCKLYLERKTKENREKKESEDSKVSLEKVHIPEPKEAIDAKVIEVPWCNYCREQHHFRDCKGLYRRF